MINLNLPPIQNLIQDVMVEVMVVMTMEEAIMVEEEANKLVEAKGQTLDIMTFVENMVTQSNTTTRRRTSSMTYQIDHHKVFYPKVNVWCNLDKSKRVKNELKVKIIQEFTE